MTLWKIVSYYARDTLIIFISHRCTSQRSLPVAIWLPQGEKQMQLISFHPFWRICQGAANVVITIGLLLHNTSMSIPLAAMSQRISAPFLPHVAIIQGSAGQQVMSYTTSGWPSNVHTGWLRLRSQILTVPSHEQLTCCRLWEYY